MPGSKKWKRRGSTASTAALAGAHARAGVDARREEHALLGEERCVVVLLVRGLSVVDAGGVDAEEDVRVGSELLDDLDVDVDAREARAARAAPSSKASGRMPTTARRHVAGRAPLAVERDGVSRRTRPRRPRSSPRRGSSRASR